jgi:hypothetical protein
MDNIWDKIIFINKEDAERKKNICLLCDKAIGNKTICSECGCIIPLKIQLTESKCPVGKW